MNKPNFLLPVMFVLFSACGHSLSTDDVTPDNLLSVFKSDTGYNGVSSGFQDDLTKMPALGLLFSDPFESSLSAKGWDLKQSKTGLIQLTEGKNNELNLYCKIKVSGKTGHVLEFQIASLDPLGNKSPEIEGLIHYLEAALGFLYKTSPLKQGGDDILVKQDGDEYYLVSLISNKFNAVSDVIFQIKVPR
jgi:hypothetical protein